MAKDLLKGYRIGGDVIDQVAADDESPGPVLKEETPPHESNSGEPAGGSPESRPQAVTDTRPPPPAPEVPIATSPSLPADEGFKAVRDGVFHLFTIGKTSYRVGGVKPLFVTSLRVNLRTSQGGMSYYDSLDLYSAKGRSGYASALNRQWGAEPSRVEKDLVVILEYLERERDAALRAGSSRPEVTISEADREAGLELLRDPKLFERISADLSALGYVGEELNKHLLYLCASSRKLDDPISVLILSQSASGKSFLVDCVKKLMPPEEVVAVTSLSDQALNYIGDLMHKFLVLGESVHGEVVEHQIREMLSGKELSRLVTIKDAETGKMQSQVVRTPVVVASVMSGTNHNINPENASRYFVVNTDESKEQTARIHEHQRHKHSLERIRAGSDEVPLIIRRHQAAQRLLEKKVVVNDFAPLLDFPTSLMRLRRDHDRFLDLIACVCYLRQYQKPARSEGGMEYISCDLADYETAYRIMVDGVMNSTVRELPKGAVVVYQEIRDWVHEEAGRQGLKMQEVSFTQRQVREATGLGHTWVKANLRQLVDYEYVVVAKGGNERSKAFYRLRADEDILKADLSMIPTPEVMRTLASGGKA
jgi:hypothetical protein